MKCEKCGNIIDNKYIWCPVCGTKKSKQNTMDNETRENIETNANTSSEEVSMNSNIQTNNNILEEKNVINKVFCSKCGQEVDSTVNFCKNCGNKLDNEKVTSSNGTKVKNFISEKSCFVIYLLFMILHIVLTLLSWVYWAINFNIWQVMITINKFVPFILLAINIYAVVKYPNNKYFKGCLVLSIGSWVI